VEQSKVMDCLPLILQLTQLKSLTLGHNHFTALWQLEPLIVLSALSQLESVTLAPNPLCEMCPNMYKPMLLVLMPQLQLIDGQAVTPVMRHRAQTLFGAFNLDTTFGLCVFMGVHSAHDAMITLFVCFVFHSRAQAGWLRFGNELPCPSRD
jgi:hypothetical protein